MIVQIYAVKSIEEARMCIEAGADRFGVVVGEKGRTPDETRFERARAIFAATPAPYSKMALTVETDLPAIEEMVSATQPDILHLSGDVAELPPQDIGRLRARLPGIEIVQAIPVSGPEAVQLALTYKDVCDAILLDTKAPGETVVGASGATHDWSISREIVRRLTVPVILAGGLSPENVAEAIRVVRPWGVDSNTHTNVPDGSWRKDVERIRLFVQAARSAT